MSSINTADVDECDPDLPPLCNEKATCINTEGSYACECYEGYQGSGVICNGVYFKFSDNLQQILKCFWT